MEKESFRKLLKQRNGVEVREDLFVFNDFEVYDAVKDESRKYFTFDDMWDAEEEVRASVDAEKDGFTVTLDGGRGADWWLRRNAKAYGYKYTARKTK